MILPFWLDLIPEQFGILYARLTRWHPEGQVVELAVDESDDPSLQKKVFRGTVLQVGDVMSTPNSEHANHVSSQCAVIKLGVPLRRNDQDILFVLVQPRFFGHGFYRLPITWNVVHLYPLDNPKLPDSAPWQNMIAICSMRLASKRRLG